MDMDGLVEYLMDIGPDDEPPTLDTEDDTPPRPKEDIEDDESIRENELKHSEDELEAKPIEQENPREEPSTEYEPEEDPGEP